MRCPFCSFAETKVIDSRAADEGSSHPSSPGMFLNAPNALPTYEMVEEIPLMVVKKDGRREMFDRVENHQWITAGLRKTTGFHWQPLKGLAEKVEKRSSQWLLEREVQTVHIGENDHRRI